jgi:hypothetical protein
LCDLPGSKKSTGYALLFQILQRWVRYLWTPGSIPVRLREEELKNTLTDNPKGMGCTAIDDAREEANAAFYLGNCYNRAQLSGTIDGVMS